MVQMNGSGRLDFKLIGPKAFQLKGPQNCTVKKVVTLWSLGIKVSEFDGKETKRVSLGYSRDTIFEPIIGKRQRKPLIRRFKLNLTRCVTFDIIHNNGVILCEVLFRLN